MLSFCMGTLSYIKRAALYLSYVKVILSYSKTATGQHITEVS